MLEAIQVLARIVTSKSSSVLLVLVTGAPQSSLGDSQLPDVCCLRGLLRTARAEIPQLHLLHIDSDEFGLGGSAQELASQVWFEVTNPRLGLHMEVAYRGGQRHIPAVDLSPNRNPITPPPQAARFEDLEPRGWVLIAGGTGQRAAVTVEVLAETGLKKFVLASRSGKVQSSFESRLRPLLSREIRVQSLDPSDAAQLAALLQGTCEEWGPLRVVVNSCDDDLDASDMPVASCSTSRFRENFSRSMDGIWQLSQQTGALGVLHFLLYSSLHSLVGPPGSLNDAAVGAFMEELCRSRQTQGLPGICVKWPSMSNSGDDADMCISEDCAKHVLKHLLAGAKGVLSCPVQAVLPRNSLLPRSPHMASLLEPLFDRLELLRWQKGAG